MTKRDPIIDPAQEAEDRKRQEAIRNLKLKTDWKQVLSTRSGRAVIWSILSEAGLFNPVFDTNALSMAFKEGRRNYGLKVLDAVMRIAPEAYQRMQEESHDR